MLRFQSRRGQVPAPLPVLFLLLFAATTSFAAAVHLSSEVPLGVPVLVPAPFHQSIRALASNGVDYLAVWYDERGGRSLFAGRIGADGRPVDPFGHKIADGTVAALTWTGSSYFVMYSSTGLGGFPGQHLDSDGNPLDAPVAFDLTGPPRDIATNGRNFLVPQYGGLTSLLGLDGRVIWKEALPDPLATSPIVVLPGGDYRYISVSRTGAAIVTVNGTSGMMSTTALPLGNASAAAASMDDSGRMLLAWIDAGTAKYELVSGSTGQVLAGPTTLGATDAFEAAAAWDGGEFLVVLRSVSALQATRIDDAGRIVAGSTLGGTASLPRFARGALGVAMAWDAGPGFNSDVYDRAAMNFAALLTAPVYALAQAATVQSAPRLAGTFAVWREGSDSATLMAQAPSHAPFALAPLAPFPTPPGTTVVTRGGSSMLVAWIDNLSGAGSRIVAKRIAPDGTPIDAQPFVVVPPSDTPDSFLIQPQVVAVASDGASFLVVWANGLGNLRAVRVGEDGRVLDAQPIAIWDRGFRSSGVSLIRAVWSGTHYVVSWVDQGVYLGGISPAPAQPGTVYVASLTANGVLATAPEQLSVNFGISSLAMAATGGNVAMLWPGSTQRNTGEICLEALPLRNDGTPLATLSELSCTTRRPGDPMLFADVGLAWNGGELVSVFTDAQNTIDAYRLDASLAPLDAAPFAVSPAGLPASQPDVSAVGNGVAIAYVRLAPEAPFGNVPRAFERTLQRVNAPPRQRPTQR